MPADPLPPIAVALAFVDAINQGNIDRLGSLMTEDHRLVVFDEPPLDGRSANVDAWRGYVTSFPAYVIRPAQLAEHDDVVAIRGGTTGSHLPPEVEAGETLIWMVTVVDGRVQEWRLVPDDDAHRAAVGLS